MAPRRVAGPFWEKLSCEEESVYRNDMASEG